MRSYVISAFAEAESEGNLAGVVLLENEDALSEMEMQQIAAQFNYSETAFVRQESEDTFSLRYFTPTKEVELCGHATIAAFFLLKALNIISDGEFHLITIDDQLIIEVTGQIIWLHMNTPTICQKLSEEETRQLCEAYHLSICDLSNNLQPRIVDAGLRDIQLCVRDHETLMRAVQDEKAVTDLSKALNVVGVHMYCPGTEESGDDRPAAWCSNFAPYYGIAEECATGTSNAGLTWYLYQNHLLQANQIYYFLQGEHMGKPCRIYSLIKQTESGEILMIGGSARIVRSI